MPKFSTPSFVVLMWVAGCSVGPDYRKPDLPVPEQFRQRVAHAANPANAVDPAGLAQGWRPVDVLRATSPKQPWWQNWWGLPPDHELVAAFLRVEKANPTIEQLAAQFRQAEAVLSAAKAPGWPSFSTTVSSARGQGSVASSGTVATGGAVRVTDKVGLSSSWELDVWGRISRNVEGGEASLAASAADLQAGILSAQATFAQTYLQWQANRAIQQLLAESVTANQRILELTESRFKAGMVSRSEVLQAEGQLNAAKAQRLDLGIQQAQFEHAMAVLQGLPPAAFDPPRGEGFPAMPVIPAMLPAQVLLNRWDVAAAERRVAAANAQIGVTQAAFFPTLSLTGSLSYQDNTFRNIISAPNRFWSVGPNMALTLFDGGARSAARAQAEAQLEQRTAAYRQVVLQALQEVEDQLAALRILDEEVRIQAQSAEAAREAVRLSAHQFAAGTVPYLNVATAQVNAVTAERNWVDAQLRRLLAGVALIKAAGG